MQLIYLALTGCCLVAALEDVEVEKAWLNFKQKFNKNSYGLMENQNFLKFQQNLEMISEHNERYKNGEVSFKMGLNQFSDMDIKDVEALAMGLKMPSDALYSNNNNTNTFVTSLQAVPDSLDWRTKGAVTPVKDQTPCGSCWAFSATGALESQVFLKTKKLIRLSEQNLVDCIKNNACSGAWPTDAFDYVRYNGGINYESTYPYEGYQNYCRFRGEYVGAKCLGYTQIARGNENDLKSAVATLGPFSVTIKVTDNFRHYNKGVLNDNSCAGSINHAVLVVGYGSENGNDYWLVKNSWGANWGDNGYIKMARNKNNQCSIASYAVTPNVYLY